MVFRKQDGLSIISFGLAVHIYSYTDHSSITPYTCQNSSLPLRTPLGIPYPRALMQTKPQSKRRKTQIIKEKLGPAQISYNLFRHPGLSRRPDWKFPLLTHIGSVWQSAIPTPAQAHAHGHAPAASPFPAFWLPCEGRRQDPGDTGRWSVTLQV